MADELLGFQLENIDLIPSSCAGTQVCWSCTSQQTPYNGGSGPSSASSSTDYNDAGPHTTTGPTSTSQSSTDYNDAGPHPATGSTTPSHSSTDYNNAGGHPGTGPSTEAAAKQQSTACQEVFKPAIAIDAETGHALNNGTAVVKLRLPCMSQGHCRY